MGRQITIAPSILSADFARLAEEVATVAEAGADALHVDVMDGHFVPNLTLGPPVIASVRRVTDLPLDVHLMIERPDRYLDAMIEGGASWITIHQEADIHLHRSIQALRSRGIRAGVAINPATSTSLLEEILPELDFVLIMSVNPGFGGQTFISRTLEKIRGLRELILERGAHASIEVDGGIDASNLDRVLDAGADIIVAGSSVFKHPEGPAEGVRALRQVADRYSRIAETT